MVASPPSPGALPVLDSRRLLSDRQGVVDQIEHLAGTTRAHFERYYLGVLWRFAAWAQQLPASESHHHCYPGGLLDHGLEVAVAALRMRQGYLLPPGASPEEAVLHKELWTYTIFVLALLHDAAKPAVDQRITMFSEESEWLWNPWECAIGNHPKARWYRVGFRRHREYRAHQQASLLVAPYLVGADGLAWLQSDPSVFGLWLAYACGDATQAGILADIIGKADGESVARSLGAQLPQSATPERVALHDKLVTALRHLIETGEMPLNRHGAAGFRVGEELWMVSKRCMDGLRAYLLLSGHTGIPADNSRLFDHLQEHGILIPNADGKAIWKMAVKVDGHADSLTLLRIPVSRLWTNPEAAPETFKGTVEPISNDFADVQAEILVSETPQEVMTAMQAPASADAVETPEGPNNEFHAPMVVAAATGLGQRCLDWIVAGLRSGGLEYNTAKARVHVVAEGVLLASPGIFKDYAALTHADDFNKIQRAFLKLKLHQATTAGLNVHQYAVAGSGAVISGLLLPDMASLFGEVVPSPNPLLKRR